MLKCECLKLKRSKIFLAGMLGTLIVPVFVIGSTVIHRLSQDEYSISLFNLYDDALNFLMLFVGPLVLTVLGAWMISREYTEGTLKNVFSVPISYHFFFIGKLLIFGIFSLAFMILSWIEILILALLCNCFFPIANFNMLSALFFLALWMIPGGILLCATLTPFLYLAIRTKGLIMPLVAITAILMVNIILSASPVAGYYPWASSYYLTVGRLSWLNCPKAVSVFIILIVCLAGIAASLIRLKKEDN